MSQLVHAAAEEAVVLNVPAAQAVTLDPDPVYPASAMQSSSASDAAGLPELVGQAAQASEPEASLNVSAEHATHDPDVPVDPDGQLGVHPPSAAVPELPPVPVFDGQAVHSVLWLVALLY